MTEQEMREMQERSKANTAKAIMLLHSILADADQATIDTTTLSHYELVDLIGGMVNIVGFCVRGLGQENGLSASDTIRALGIEILQGSDS